MVMVWKLETDYTENTAAMSLCVCKEQHLLLISILCNTICDSSTQWHWHI